MLIKLVNIVHKIPLKGVGHWLTIGYWHASE